MMIFGEYMKRIFFFLIFFICIHFIWAQDKYALVIGNASYTSISKLDNPVNDANDISDALQRLGFNVEKLINAELEQIENAVLRLKNRLSISGNSYGFFYYAGHGVQSNGENYLIPLNASIPSESHLRTRAFSVQTMLNNLNEAGNKLNIIVLDACRDNPFGWKRSGTRGLAMISAPAGSIVVFATSANSTASDGNDRNGLFTGQLLKNLNEPSASVRDIFDKTGRDVLSVSGGKQRPEISISFFDMAYFNASSVSSSDSEKSTIQANNEQPSKLAQSTQVIKTQTYNIGDRGPGGGIIFKIILSNDNYEYFECTEKLGSATWAQAALNVRNFRGGGCSDWRLPNDSDIQAIHRNLHINGLVVFDNNSYWSVSQQNESDAYIYFISRGVKGTTRKTMQQLFLAVRSFR